MAETEESKLPSFATNHFRKFMSANQFPPKFQSPKREFEEDEDIELSLGLSLNGQFGVDPKRHKGLFRSSSIPDFVTPREISNGFVIPELGFGNLVRTSSLPVETEELRKRREVQSLRRMEAKRKRSEKQRNSTIPSRDLNPEEKKNLGVQIGGFGGNGYELKIEKDNSLLGGSSQGSGGSPGSGLSGISDFESQQALGTNKCADARTPANDQSLSEKDKKPSSKVNGSIVTETSGNLSGISAKPAVVDPRSKETVRNLLEDMPYVSTKSNGHDGKRVEGFLYRYRKGEGVRIVCVCHGRFWTPAEFVKHGGGGDVAHPLKHIVVNPSSFL